MNIFFLDNNPRLAAQYHMDKHVVKMVLETAQLLCGAHRTLDDDEIFRAALRSVLSGFAGPKEPFKYEHYYKLTHKNHPCSVWVRESGENYEWTFELFRHLCREYTYRYGKVHLSETKLLCKLVTPPINIPCVGLTKPALAMPDQYKTGDAVEAYRSYYINEKKNLAKWTKRSTPYWYHNDEVKSASI